MEPRTITQAEAADLLASGYETGRYEPLGLFLVGEAGGTWTGIDNSTGNAWTEEFGTQAECLKWLKGEKLPTQLYPLNRRCNGGQVRKELTKCLFSEPPTEPAMQGLSAT